MNPLKILFLTGMAATVAVSFSACANDGDDDDDHDHDHHRHGQTSTTTTTVEERRVVPGTTQETTRVERY